MKSPHRVNYVVIATLLAISAFNAWAGDERVQLQTPTGTLQGTLDLPSGTAPHPVVLIIAGSGATDRDGNQAQLKNDSLKPYLISWFKYDRTKEIAALNVPMLIVQGTTDFQVFVADAKRLVAANKTARLSLIDGMNHVLKQAKEPAEQQAAYTNPALPIKAVVVEEIAAFMTTSGSSGNERRSQ